MAAPAKRDQKNPELLILASINALQENEAKAKAALAAGQSQIEVLQSRMENPRAGDTAETLAKIDDELRRGRVTLALAKRDYESAVAMRSKAESELQRAENERQRKELQARLDEMVRTMPPVYRRLAEELVALVAGAHQLDREIIEYNKRQPPGGDFLSTFETLVRWPPPSKEGRRSFYPAPLAQQFEIPALRPGDNFRVPGTHAPGGIWFDANGRPQ